MSNLYIVGQPPDGNESSLLKFNDTKNIHSIKYERRLDFTYHYRLDRLVDIHSLFHVIFEV